RAMRLIAMSGRRRMPFFFQAEDGIRDFHVTGVQTCALPICPVGRRIPVWALPEDRYLVAPSVRDVLRAVDGTLIDGDPQVLSREVLRVVMSGMSMVNVLPRLHESARRRCTSRRSGSTPSRTPPRSPAPTASASRCAVTTWSRDSTTPASALRRQAWWMPWATVPSWY